ncbi:MAG: hypothetical protein IPK35_13280 [Saprospiraceae bacterium]|jgi:hypothetical protein|nr:hypothetical protein [Saprospiraceae bacterium]
MRLLTVFIFTIFVFACKEKQVAEEKKTSPLYDEVMAIHDKVMPEMSTIHALKRDLKAIEKPASKEIIIKNIIALDNADEAMMSWMADFKVPEDKSKEAEYLNKEKEVIQSVSDQMYGSIHQAQKLLDSLKTMK